MNYKKLGYFLLKSWLELLSFLFAIISASIAYKYISQPGTIFGFSILLTTILLALTLYFHFKEKDLFFIALDNYADKENWFGSGKFELDKRNKAYLVADSDAGFIFSKCLLWKDYSMRGSFKILNKHLGVILRATDLSNYIMLQITKNSIRPHVRANGGWIPYETNTTGLSFEHDIKDGEWYKFEFIVSGELVEIKIFDKKTILIDKSWNITSGRVSVPVYEKEDENRKSPTHILDFIVSYDYGAVGFRNGHGEKALVKDLLINSINNTNV